MTSKKRAAGHPVAARNPPMGATGLVLDRRTSITFFVIAIANKIVASASQSYMRHYRIGIMEWRVMALLAADSGISARDITILSGVTAGSVSRAISSLRRLGYVRVDADRTDNRRSVLTLTRTGRALHDRVIRSSLSREQLLLTGFSHAEYAMLLRSLERLSANVGRLSAHVPAGSERQSKRGRAFLRRSSR